MRNIYIILTLFLLCGCTEEKLFDEGGSGTGQASVEFTLLMPSSSVTRAGNVFAAPAYENEMKDLLLFVFRGGELSEIEKPRNISLTGITAKFSLHLPATTQPVKFYVLANLPVYYLDKTAGEGTEVEILNALRYKLKGKTPEEIKNLIDDYVPKMGKQGVAAPFPMWGEYDRPTGIPEALPEVNTQIADMKMIRGVARAIITKSVDDAVFKISSVRVHRMHTGMKIIPNAHANNIVSEPSLPTDRTYSFVSGIEVPAGDAAVSFYLTESPGYPPQDADKDATCIIVGGYYNGSTVETYYRIDFKTDPQRVGEIKRNHSYSFNITSVSAPGSPDPETITGEAILTATIEEWENVWGEAIYSNEHYMTLTSRTITVPGTKGSSHYIDVSTDVKNFTIEWPGSISTGTDKWEDDFFVLERTEIPLSTQTPDYIPNKSENTSFFRLRVTAKTSNISVEPRLQPFTIKAANLTVPMQIKQSPPVYLRPATTFTWITSDGLKAVNIDIQSSHNWFISRIYDGTDGSIQPLTPDGNPIGTQQNPQAPSQESKGLQDMTADPWIMCEKITPNTLRVYGKPNNSFTVESSGPFTRELVIPKTREGSILLENEEGAHALIVVHQEVWIDWHPSYMIGATSDPDEIGQTITNPDGSYIHWGAMYFHSGWTNLFRYYGTSTTYRNNDQRQYYHPSDKLYGSANNYFRPAQPVGDHRDLFSWETNTTQMPANYNQLGDFLYYDGAVMACMTLPVTERIPIFKENYPDLYYKTYWDIPTEGEVFDLFLRFQISPNHCHYVTNPDGAKIYFPNVGNSFRTNNPTGSFVHGFHIQHPSYDTSYSIGGDTYVRRNLYNWEPPAGRLSQQRKLGSAPASIQLWNNDGHVVRCIRRVAEYVRPE